MDCFPIAVLYLFPKEVGLAWLTVPAHTVHEGRDIMVEEVGGRPATW